MSRQEQTFLHISKKTNAAYVGEIKQGVTGEQPATPLAKDEGGGKVAKWFDPGNDYPDKIIKDINAVPTLSATLYWKANALISGGLVYGEVNYDDDGNETLKPQRIPEIEAFLQTSNYRRFLRKMSTEFYKFWNVFPTLIFDENLSKVAGFKCNESAWCRWGLQDKNDGVIKDCYINTNWQENNEDSPSTIHMPVINPYFGSIDSVKNRNDGNQFIYPVSGESSGQAYYELAPWDSIRQSKWLDVVKMIPEFKYQLMKNQMTIRYVIKMPDWWMEWKYKGEWENFEPEKRRTLVEAEYDKFDTFLSGVENSGKSIAFMMKTTSDGKLYEGWTIEEVPNSMKFDAAYNEDSEIGTSYIFNALGVHASLVATSPGKSSMNSKGSEIRNLFNMHIANCKPEQDILLEPFHFIRDFNGWNPNIQFWFRNYFLTTLDQTSTKDRNFNAGEQA
ncbi:hypothetical protein V6R21_06285 [Limibacter armeniacum]|uniref:hypothetical protein n=1 Tax=Limibacter armeniacum TaxID=466084 RepID=UPI002FE6BB4F